MRRAAVVTHGQPERIRPALVRVEQLAREAGVELLEDGGAGPIDADVAIVLGGDGTMLRALQRFLGTGVAAIGVNFGRVGFLASIERDDLEPGLRRVFAGDFRVTEQATLEVEIDGASRIAVNDVVLASSAVGRMIELSWTIGDEELGLLPCDGIVCATPTGSTAYNLSVGGPVLVWGIDAMAVTFIAPHSLHARPLVVPRSLDLELTNETRDVPVTVLTDGRPLGLVQPGGRATVRLGEQRSLLAMLPESTFFQRYRRTFAS